VQYREANERLARLRHFNIEEWELQVETTIRDSRAWLESAAFASPAGNRKWGENLVFIVGMPRSGTSLCEQVLCSHSRILGAGELATMEYITRALKHDSCDPFGADAHWLNPMRREYLASLPPSVGQYERVSDKSPRNFERLGLVFRLFPGARVLWCQRHPLDTIISCYFQDFQDGQRFSNSLDHIARMYLGHVRLMRHWMSWFAGSIEVIEYSTLVRNLEATARRMAEFVGLDYEAAMCQPHRNPRLTLTASSQQVRQPVYTGSIDNWRHYREELREVASLLQEHDLLDSECRSIMATTAEPGGN
jgi:hypothetical protein